MSQIRNAVLVAGFVVAVGGVARAEDQAVVSRLSSHGGLSSNAAKKLVGKISQRMSRSADAPPSVQDSLRAAFSQALIGTPVAGDAMTAAKVRLKLFAGLNEFALETLFAPQPGAIAGCVRDVGATQSECEALVAAAARSSVSQAKREAGGPAQSYMAAAPARKGFNGGYNNAAPAANGGRFGSRFGSGYQQAPAGNRGYPQQPQQAYQPAPQRSGFSGGYQAPGYRQQGGYNQNQAPGYAAAQGYGNARQQANFGGGYPQQQNYAAPARPTSYAAPQQAARPSYAAPQQPAAAPYRPVAAPQRAYAPPVPAIAAPAPVAPAANPAEVAARKEAYKQQREAYLARQKQQFEQRKEKITALDVNPAAESVAVSAASRTGAAPAAPAAAPEPKPEPAKVAGKQPPKLTTDQQAEDILAGENDAPPAAAKGEKKALLDNDFLDGLLDDPLAKNKKK
jgi:hypothetical protein